MAGERRNADNGLPASPDRVGGLPRAITRLAALAGWTTAMYAVRVAVLGLVLVSGSAERAGRRWVLRQWARGTLRILGIRLKIEGQPPARPFLLVSNHVSYIDPICFLAAAAPVFVAMSEISGWPLIGFLVRTTGNTFITRQNLRDTARINAWTAKQLSEKCEGVIVFPEAHTSAGDDVLPFKPALLAPAVARGTAVQYACIRHETPEGTPPARSVVCWGDDTPFLVHAMRMLRLQGFDTALVFGEDACRAENRKALAAQLHEKVRACLLAQSG